jgi:RNA methyltransferase, TrmH family
VNDPLRIRSRDNALLVKLRRLAQDGASCRRLDLLWLEGEHLCRAAVARRVPVAQALLSEAGWLSPPLRELSQAAARVAVLPDALWRGISSLPSPAAIGFVLDVPAPPRVMSNVASVVLDRLQDPGNAGSILRSAAALGVHQVLALQGTVSLWSPKVLRAGMGAHFALELIEGLAPAALDALGVPLLATSSHAAAALGEALLPHPAAWIFGHEGQGVDAALMARCVMTLRIPQPGGEESLNVAAAAAICLYESSRGFHNQ